MKREEYKQTKYTDEQDGPSPMQILGSELGFKERNPDQKTCFELERDIHNNEI